MLGVSCSHYFWFQLKTDDLESRRESFYTGGCAFMQSIINFWASFFSKVRLNSYFWQTKCTFTACVSSGAIKIGRKRTQDLVFVYRLSHADRRTVSLLVSFVSNSTCIFAPCHFLPSLSFLFSFFPFFYSQKIVFIPVIMALLCIF